MSLLCSNLTDVNEQIMASLDSRVPVFDASEVKIGGPQKFVENLAITLIHSHVINIDDAFFNYKNTKCSVPYVVTLHGSHQDDDLNVDALLFRMVKGVTKWVYLADRNLQIFGDAPLQKDAFVKIPNAMPADPRPFPKSRKQLGLDEDTVVFTLVARGIQRKGWRAAVEALKLLRRCRPELKVHVLMAGAGPQTEEVAASVDPSLPITFLGYQSCINGLYRMSDCALAPTRFGGRASRSASCMRCRKACPSSPQRSAKFPT